MGAAGGCSVGQFIVNSTWFSIKGVSRMVSTPRRTGRLHILAVEDDEDTAQNLALLLRWEGHEVDLAPDGPTALHSAQVHQPDVVLLDIGLPGMNGYDVARHL